MEPVVYIVKPEQVGHMEINEFLRQAISKQFEGTNYSIITEQTLDRITRYSNGKMRKIKGYSIDVGGENHTIYFDVTEVSINISKTAGLG
jgi:hypothetical protein